MGVFFLSYEKELQTHTTAWDRHWGGDETLKLVLVYRHPLNFAVNVDIGDPANIQTAKILT